MPLRDHLERLLLSLEKQALLVTVRGSVGEGVYPIHWFKMAGSHGSVDASAVIAYIDAVLLVEHPSLLRIFLWWRASIVLIHARLWKI